MLGTILKDGVNITGITTAASLLFITCIGMCIGAGFYIGGVVGTLILYVILTLPYKYGNGLNTKLINFEWDLKYKDEFDIEKMQEIFDNGNFTITHIKVNEESKTLYVKGRYDEPNKNKTISRLMKELNITEIVEG